MELNAAELDPGLERGDFILALSGTSLSAWRAVLNPDLSSRSFMAIILTGAAFIRERDCRTTELIAFPPGHGGGGLGAARRHTGLGRGG